MKVKLQNIKVKDLFDGYVNNNEEGVLGYKGLLNIRPKYQREFVYKDKKRDLVIDTVRKDFPLNVMYWVENDDGSFEVLDGQQRSISICEYIEGSFSIDYQYFHNLEKEEQDQILDYELMVYFCEGTDKEKLDWFETINIAGEKLTDQELRNAVYTGPWLEHAKKYFSKSNCPAHQIASKYLKGSAIRQEFLETAISWISGGKVKDYMSKHQHDPNANELWLYFESVIKWVELIFPNYRKEMKGVDFGALYEKYKDSPLDQDALESEILALMQDDDVTKKSGIYTYVLTREEKHLNIRAFTAKQRREAYERQGGVCPITHQKYPIEEMEADHIIPWSKGGKTNADNCQMVYKRANREKSDK